MTYRLSLLTLHLCIAFFDMRRYYTTGIFKKQSGKPKHFVKKYFFKT